MKYMLVTDDTFNPNWLIKQGGVTKHMIHVSNLTYIPQVMSSLWRCGLRSVGHIGYNETFQVLMWPGGVCISLIIEPQIDHSLKIGIVQNTNSSSHKAILNWMKMTGASTPYLKQKEQVYYQTCNSCL